MVSEKIYFLEIGSVNQKLWPFKCMMLKTLNSTFLERKDTLNHGSAAQDSEAIIPPLDYVQRAFPNQPRQEVEETSGLIISK